MTSPISVIWYGNGKLLGSGIRDTVNIVFRNRRILTGFKDDLCHERSRHFLTRPGLSPGYGKASLFKLKQASALERLWKKQGRQPDHPGADEWSADRDDGVPTFATGRKVKDSAQLKPGWCLAPCFAVKQDGFSSWPSEAISKISMCDGAASLFPSSNVLGFLRASRPKMQWRRIT